MHGEEEAKKAQETARSLFGGGTAADMPETELNESDLSDGVCDILTILVKSGLCSSKGDARRNIQQGGVEAAGEKVTDISKSFDAAALSEGIVVKRGKKNFRRVVLK